VGIFLQLTWWTYGPTIGPSIAIAGEVSATRLRAKSLAIGFTFNYVFSTVMNVIMPYLFNHDQADLGGKIGWIFTVMGVIAFFVVFLEVPETKARSFQELDTMFIERVPTKEFKRYKHVAQSNEKEVGRL
jgi:SP family general alpha glucoside:H+ symporter-like MFS transporter